MSNTLIHASKIPQLSFVCKLWRPRGKVVSNIREMQQYRYRINQENGPNHLGDLGTVYQMRRDDAAVRVANEYKLIPAMLLKDLEDLVTKLLPCQCRTSDAKGDRHYLNSNDSNLAIIIVPLWLVDLIEKIDVRIQADSDSMDEEHRQSIFGGMGPMPVRQRLSWRFLTAEKREGAWWEYREESFDRKTMESKSSEKQPNMGD